ncbi:HlyD family type I secretion periplasmic adaptor subunit [Escherichia coli]|uniref:HlyD family type I secretion periplasmic adaptor subunit n=2 Tax=Escherichia coli TaxID=562 RepID=UPI000BE6C420|nr:HlyD family type I secretion periplasmic adaptor subunit [Escherichia coli]MBB8665943.1 HlyD family type I secretion periplasmic adaptor subunit [Escherichia coli]
MKLWIQGISDLVKKYFLVFREAWSIRKSLDVPKRLRDEYDFLPAHLELTEKPVSPLPRIVARTIMVFLILMLLISIFYKVEIVAVAPGQLILSGRSKIIQPLETSRVNKVYVRNGEKAQKGQLLISLTAIGAEAENAQNESVLAQSRLDEQRLEALLKATESNVPPTMAVSAGPDAERANRLMQEQFTAWATSREQQQAIIRQKNAEQAAIKSRIVKLEQQKHIAEVKLSDIRALYKKQAISKHQLLDQENQYVEITNELEVLRNQIKEASETVAQANNEYKLLKQTFRRDLMEQLTKTRDTIRQVTHELDKNRERRDALQITSPVDGVVQQLATFTEGGVVTTAQTLMVIVPEHDHLDARIKISNKDIGFVSPGQSVVIKVEAFPYTRHGYLHGVVRTVSREVVEDNQKGLYFEGDVTLTDSTIMVQGKQVTLTSGMSITAEIITGYRRVIDFILSPIRETIDESLSER